MTYCSIHGSDCDDISASIRTGVEPLFHTYGVDLVVNAHQHCYKSTFPVFQGVISTLNQSAYNSPQYPLYVTLYLMLGLVVLKPQ